MSNPVDDRRNAARRQCRDDRDRAAGPQQQRPHAQRTLERVLTQPDRVGVRRHEAGFGVRPALELQLGAVGSRLAEQLLDLRPDHVRVLPRASRIEKFASATTGITVF